jgi:hypothetical protein
MTPAAEGRDEPRAVKIVYCGGCNPQIDRAAVAAALPAGEDAPGEVTVHVSGCPRACASDHQLLIDRRGGGGGGPGAPPPPPPPAGGPGAAGGLSRWAAAG